MHRSLAAVTVPGVDLDADAENFRRALATVTGSASASCARVAMVSGKPGQFQPIHAVPDGPSLRPLSLQSE